MSIQSHIVSLNKNFPENFSFSNKKKSERIIKEKDTDQFVEFLLNLVYKP